MTNKLIKKIAVALTVATMAISATSMTANAYTQYVNNDIGLNVRVRPDKNSKSLGGLYRGDAVDVIGAVGDGWVKINYNGHPAYVRNCLSNTRPSQNVSRQTTTTTTTKRAGNTYIVKVPSGFLALRTSPRWTDNDSNVIEQLYSGQRFTVTGRSGQYCYGYSNRTGQYGYVNADYLC